MGWQDMTMQVTARIDYAVRALVELASSVGRVTRDELADRQAIPPRYLEVVLAELRRGGLIVGHRGSAGGGYSLGRPADEITVAMVARAVDGPLTVVQGVRPEMLRYEGTARHVTDLWVALRASVRSVLESVTIAQLASGDLPPEMSELLASADAWEPRWEAN